MKKLILFETKFLLIFRLQISKFLHVIRFKSWQLMTVIWRPAKLTIYTRFVRLLLLRRKNMNYFILGVCFAITQLQGAVT